MSNSSNHPRKRPGSLLDTSKPSVYSPSSTQSKRQCNGLLGSSTLEAYNASFLDQLGTDIVELRVGEQRTLFRVHQNTLCDGVEFFDKLFRGSFKESTEKTAELPEDSPEAFELMLEWCYKGKLPQCGDVPAQFRKDACWKRLKVYCFAEKYNIIQLMDHSIDFLLGYLKKDRQRLPPQWCIYAYDNSPGGSLLRILISRHCYYSILHSSVEGRYASTSFSSTAPPDLVHDIFAHMRTLSKLTVVKEINPVTAWTLSDCTYHCHTIAGDARCPYKP